MTFLKITAAIFMLGLVSWAAGYLRLRNPGGAAYLFEETAPVVIGWNLIVLALVMAAGDGVHRFFAWL